ncbi:hypothetical protein KAR91_65790 [Candidatus Pacearchaeota archaeon]|nr:hypothetical protein [Candidatus Pacearchaeota archaeon]
MNREEKYYQCRGKNQREPYTTTTISNNAELYQNYRQNSDLTASYVLNKMREFWSGIIQEIEEEYRDAKANGSRS